MDYSNDIRRSITALIKEAVQTISYGTVDSVNATTRTAVVTVGRVKIEDVLLYAAQNSELKGLVLLPKVGSVVLVAKVASGRYFIVMQSEQEAMQLTIGDKTSINISEGGMEFIANKTKVEFSPAGVVIERDSYGLKQTLDGLIDAITKLTVTTGVGPSGVPVNIADFAQIKQDLNKYLK